ncbi:MAG TPA: NlpC/P60 family protein [Pseudonocardiaceae bacterium]
MSSHRRLRKTVRGAVTATAVTALVTLVPTPATADPANPDNSGDSSDAVRQLQDLNHQAEVLTEKWHFARDQLDARQADLARANADAGAAAAAGDQARAVEDQYRGQVDQLTNASFQGARLNKLSALLVSKSPNQFLDQMSALDMLATNNKEAMDRLSGAVSQAEQAERRTTDAAARATQAERDAARLEGDLTHARQDMDRQISTVQSRLDKLSRQERASYTSGGFNLPINIPGSGVAADALRAALSKQGSDYVYGADGPSTFDCSGLVKWAFEQAGMSGLPHSAAEQAQMGTSVSRSELQPGDLIALYSPISHIGIYTGSGRYVNAPQTGDVVKVSNVPWSEVTAMRRLG